MAEEANEVQPSDTSNDVIENNQEVQSSSAESETEDDLLAVVQKASQPKVDEEEQTEVTESQSDENVETREDGDLDTPIDDQSDDADDEPLEKGKSVPYPRFKKVIDERNKFKLGFEENEKINKFQTTNNLSTDEMADGMKIMALVKNNPLEAYKALKPVVDSLAVQAGEVLPDDLKSKVNDGYMDEDTANELAKTRAEKSNLENKVQNLNTQQQASNQVEQAKVLNDIVVNWETSKKKSDPDFDQKKDTLLDRMRAEVAQNGVPPTQDGIVKMLDGAYTTVSDRYAKISGNKTPIRTPSGNKLSGTPTSQPNSLEEAIQNSLAEMGS